jgi:hypothetical protein
VDGTTTTECWACGSALNPVWRFCIRCGVPVERDELHIELVEPPRPAPLGARAVTGIVLGGVVLLVGIVLLASLLLHS